MFVDAFDYDTEHGVMEKKHYISAGGTIAVLTVRSDNPTVTETRYLHGDYLGSTDVITIDIK